MLVLAIVGGIALSLAAFNETFTRTVPVTLTADRSGLVMEPNAKVKMRGVQVGHVATITGGTGATSLQLDIDPDQIQHIPANVTARIDTASLFGQKFVDLVYPSDPSPQRLSAGAVLKSQNVTVEVNTLFENVVKLVKQIDPYKLNAVLSALSEGLRGRGEQIGQSITDTNEVLLALNSRTDTMREDFRSLKNLADTYSVAAPDLIATVDALSTTATTVTTKAGQLDQLLVGVAGLSRSGIGLLGPNKDNFIQAVNLLEPTTSLLMKYNPELTCMLVGAQKTNDGLSQMLGGSNGKSLIMDAALMLGDDPYRYPDNLPIVAAKGGPGGKPGCGSLPDVAQNWPVRYLVADTGFGTGMDMRPNPGIGFPGYVDYLPVTRGVPEPPSIRYPGGPAPGPIPYLGAPPYGAPQYGPDGTPLYPGVPAPPPPATAPPAMPGVPGQADAAATDSGAPTPPP
ncbi:MAG: ABC-type transport system involved in resistance to organic solvent, periplasmic component [Mycobacterium sp.]|nr:ABC-type transport system involved in resistance to organic solvent, periplasmic component [Mycobacterium sp.]